MQFLYVILYKWRDLQRFFSTTFAFCQWFLAGSKNNVNTCSCLLLQLHDHQVQCSLGKIVVFRKKKCCHVQFVLRSTKKNHTARTIFVQEEITTGPYYFVSSILDLERFWSKSSILSCHSSSLRRKKWWMDIFWYFF